MRNNDVRLSSQVALGSGPEQLLTLSLISETAERLPAVYLGGTHFTAVTDSATPLKAKTLMAALPRYLGTLDGTIHGTHRFHPMRGQEAPKYQTIDLGNESMDILLDGVLFASTADDRLVIKIASERGEGYTITVQSTMDPAGFIRKWTRYAQQHAYVRGRAFFPNGGLVQHTRKYTWSDICLPPQVREMLDVHVCRFVRQSKLVQKLGMKGRRGMLLTGPPGTGKTLLGKVLADELHVPFMWVLPHHITLVTSVTSLFADARLLAPCVIFLEDLDLFGEDRTDRGGQILGELMNQLDGVADNAGITVLATTNRLEMIEKALRNRPGRFDRVIELPVMDDAQRGQLITAMLAQCDVDPDIIDDLIAATEDQSGAVVEELVNTLLLLAIDDTELDDADGATMRVPIDRSIASAAIEDMQLTRKRCVGFHAELSST